MQLFKSVLAGALLVASVVAQGKVAFTSFPSDVQAGKPVQVTWAGGELDKPVVITLKNGDSEDLKDVAVLTSSATGGSWTWTPSTSLTDGEDYALQIEQNGEINYTNQFSISGGSGEPTESQSSASETGTSTATMTLTGTDSTTLATSTRPSSSLVTSTHHSNQTATFTSSASRGISSSIPRNTTTVNVPTLTSTFDVTMTASVTPTESEPAEPTESDSAASSISLSSPLAFIMAGLMAFAYLN